MVDISAIRGVPRRQNSEFGFKCPISIAALMPVLQNPIRLSAKLLQPVESNPDYSW